MDIQYLPECDSTNAWAKENYARLTPIGAVYTENQTGGRGRLGRRWENAPGQALYYTAVVARPLAQPETLPQLMSLVAAQALAQQFGVACQIKWPNDLLLHGKKIAGILCESTVGPAAPDQRIWILGIGINLCQPQSCFDAQGLPYAGSLAAAGVAVDPRKDIPALANRLTALLAHQLETFAAEGFAPLRQDYCRACINLGRTVTWEKRGQPARGVCIDVDENGRLVVRTDAGAAEIFTGEVSVQGIYGTL